MILHYFSVMCTRITALIALTIVVSCVHWSWCMSLHAHTHIYIYIYIYIYTKYNILNLTRMFLTDNNINNNKKNNDKTRLMAIML